MRTKIVSIFKNFTEFVVDPIENFNWIETIDIPVECKECVVRQIIFQRDKAYNVDHDQTGVYTIYSSLNNGSLGSFAIDDNNTSVNLQPQTVIFLTSGQSKQINFSIRKNNIGTDKYSPVGLLNIILEFK